MTVNCYDCNKHLASGEEVAMKILHIAKNCRLVCDTKPVYPYGYFEDGPNLIVRVTGFLRKHDGWDICDDCLSETWPLK